MKACRFFSRARAGSDLSWKNMWTRASSPSRKSIPRSFRRASFRYRIRAAVENDGAKFILIDSLNGYLHCMAEERYLNLQLHELLTYLNQLGIVTMMVVTPHGLLGNMQTPIDVTYLADTVVTLRFFEADGAVHKAISIIKKRTGGHENTIRELQITAKGI